MKTNQFLLINRYTCPATKNVFIQAHEVDKDSLSIIKSYSKMAEDDITLFSNYNLKIIIDVSKSGDLSKFGNRFINDNYKD